MPDPQPRRLGPPEVAAAEAVLAAAFADYARRLGRAPSPEATRAADALAAGGLVLALGPPGAVAAVAALRPEPSPGVWLLAHLGVAPEGRGRGAGARLLAAAEAAARAEGARRLALITAAFREDLVGFYARRGFAITWRGPPGHALDPHERVRMEKPLV